MSNPFSSSKSRPGNGTIHLALLPPSTPRIRTIEYQYPLKLVSPAPLWTEEETPQLIHTVYLLAYGGGLVAGDCIDLRVVLESNTRLILLTQGSTKLFKAASRDILSRQALSVHLAPGTALCYLPDPVQPFAQSSFEQQQTYNLEPIASSAQRHGSLCVLDWVSNGRPANGENWSFHRYTSRNEIYIHHADGRRRLLLRDSLVLDAQITDEGLVRRMDGLAVYGTLIFCGHVFERLGAFFMEEFKILPRIGARQWDSGSDDGNAEVEDARSLWRAERQRREKIDGLMWSAASVRSCVVVKFGAPLLESARQWLHSMLLQEGSVSENFGERALLCLRW